MPLLADSDQISWSPHNHNFLTLGKVKNSEAFTQRLQYFGFREPKYKRHRSHGD